MTHGIRLAIVHGQDSNIALHLIFQHRTLLALAFECKTPAFYGAENGNNTSDTRALMDHKP
jgi:hypothetical protein